MIVFASERRTWTLEQQDLDLNLNPLALLFPLMSYQHIHLHMPKTYHLSPRIHASSNISNLEEMAQVSTQLPVLESWFSHLMLSSSLLIISRIFESFSPLHPYCHHFIFHLGYWKTLNRPCCCHFYPFRCILHTKAERYPFEIQTKPSRLLRTWLLPTYSGSFLQLPSGTLCSRYVKLILVLWVS